ncbi:MAG: YceK/YidQ family lipoprotein [Methylobacter sp.]
MKSAIGKRVIVAFISCLMLSCSSIRARTEMSEMAKKEWGLYPGVRQDIKDMGGTFSGKRSDPSWVKGWVTTLLVLDLPFSATFDTVVLPYDIYRISVPNASSNRGGSSGRSSPF